MTTLRRPPSELPLTADRATAVPLAGQIAAQLRAAMTDGRLAAGERLVSSRALATSLGVSRTVVTAAYGQLFAEGWVEGRHGAGTFVAAGAPTDTPTGTPAGDRAGSGGEWQPLGGPPGGGPRQRAETGGGGQQPLIDLRAGIPWAQGIDRAAWRRAWRGAGLRPAAAEHSPQGLPGLRAALSGYLRRSRGVVCGPGQVLVTRGVAGSLGLIAAALLAPGDLVGVEEPGYPAARAVFGAHGARVVACRVDADGLVVDELPAGLRLIYTTPAHQYPLGGRLPVPRRQALISWARATGAVIVEDDYDGEFRYDVAPLPALFGLDPGVVVYLGTTTKILAPGVRVGWLVARPDLARRLTEVAAALGDGAGEAAQAVVLALIEGGDLDRHVRRMRHVYARRRAAMVSGLRGIPGPLLGDQAGMHVVLMTGADAAVTAAAARERGVALTSLARYFAGPPTGNGLVLGYGGATATDVAAGCRILADVLGGRAAPGRR